MDMNLYTSATLAISVVAVGVALITIIRQEEQIAKSLRLQAYLKLADEWKDPELSRQVISVMELWKAWKGEAWKEGKGSNVKEWSKFIEQRAKEWVIAHGNELLKWEDRRAVSQFLSKLGPIITNGYLKSNDVFGVVPEMGRLLSVLIPIEIAIQKEFGESSKGTADWDFPFPKWEFRELWPAYFKWFRSRAGKRCLKLEPINWTDPRVGLKLPGR
jgi:hypothetical protein